MKIATVIPLYKTGDKHLSQFSLSSQKSKKFFFQQKDDFIEKHGLLSDNQYGFRSNPSTSQALIELIEEITNAMDTNKYAVRVFIEKKVFDTINHDILKKEKKKTRKIWDRGIAPWVKSYLNDRRQFMKMGEVQSGWLEIVCGAPQ